MKNIEIKVRVGGATSLSRLARLARGMGAVKKGVLFQTDTYFRVATGRLKLREMRGMNSAELIFYARPNRSGSKTSSYEIYRVSQKELVRLKRILSVSLGILVVVKKRRELYLYKHTRIHLDNITGLSDHCELETVVGAGGVKSYIAEHNNVIKTLGLNKLEKVPVSYSDLLIK